MLRSFLLLCLGVTMNAMTGCAWIIGIEDLPDLVDAGVTDGIATVDAREGCGNGTQEFGEACDDGAETARCNADCSLAECGDGNLNRTAGEECDDENLQSGDGCSASCRTECGNERIDEGEGCDEGPLSTSRCDADCTLSLCGDGFFNPAARELCDVAGASSLTCDADCTLARCGDGIVNVENGEECDLGGVNSVGCNFDCTLPQCGDGILNPEANEECDDGNLGNNDQCRSDCRLPATGTQKCGDFRMDPTQLTDRFEQCDDGLDGDDEDECTDDCTFGPLVIFDNDSREGQECEPDLDELFACDADHTFRICGDGFINRAAGEQCDDGNFGASDDCSACVLTKCGDGLRGPFEQCDDGNRVPGDGCGADCQKECGNGRINAGEHCDDGNFDDDDVCTYDCSFGPTVILDNDVREGQECVPALDGADACDPDFTFVRCGDGFLNISAAEECDDGNKQSDDGCSASCQIECGDGVRGRFEQCDDGNDVDGDACRNDCTFGPTVILDNDLREGEECVPVLDGVNACDPDRTRVACGDGFTNDNASEDCDDGSLFVGDGCSNGCKREYCGNGRIDGFEQCDGDVGALDTCNSDCTFGPAVIFDDGVHQGAECEPALAGVCDPDHTFVRCGDRFVNAGAGEQCDDGNTALGDGCSPACQVEPDDLPVGG